MDRSCRVAASGCKNRTDLAGQLHARVRPWVLSCDGAALSVGRVSSHDALDRLLSHRYGYAALHAARSLLDAIRRAHIARPTIDFFRIALRHIGL